MKSKLLLMLSAVALIAACSNSVDEKIRAFIPGSYVHFSETEKIKVWDTLVFDEFNEKTRTFFIVTKSGFHRIQKGKLQPKSFATDTAIGVFDPVTYQVQNPVSGARYTFYPDRGRLSTGISVYEKID